MSLRYSLLFVIALASHASAQSAEAEQLFQDGDRLMAQNKLAEACAAFEGSNRIEPRAGTLVRLGECREKNHQLASAWSAYTDALARAKDPKKREIAQAALRALTPRLSKLTIRVVKTPGLRITRNGKLVDEALWNRPTPVDGGRYEIEASASDRRPRTFSIEVPPEAGQMTQDIPELERIVVPLATALVPDRDGRARDEPRSFTMRRKLAVGFAVLGAGGLALGGVLGKQARTREADAFALCPDAALACDRAPQAQATLDSAHTRATYANIAFAGGGVLIVGAAILWLTGAPETVHPVATADQIGLVIAGGF